ncbi:hypothetical protein CROQUDRAFT_41740, partial [Cronartium quercuum f. sp. fusiforme G11]
EILDCCSFKIISNQLNFKYREPALEEIIEKARHLCMFLPKFPCELNPNELEWNFIKTGQF